MTVSRTHPRYESLVRRERLIDGFTSGIVCKAGLIAHGRGEAFDYLLGERTTPEAELAERMAASLLLDAEKPVISVNGNVAALCPESLVELSSEVGAPLEVNLFYRTEERVKMISEHLREAGAKEVLGVAPDAVIPHLEHDRALCSKSGIFSADVILVPLEDGDRAQALRDMGKTTIVIDLNPLSRSSKTANVTIVDEVTRAIPNIIKHAKDLKENPSGVRFDNAENLRSVIQRIDLGDHSSE